MSIGKNIVKLREAKDWTQRELARRVGLNPSVMNRIELGERPAKDEEIIALAKVLGCSTDQLLGVGENSPISKEVYNSLSSYQQEVIDWMLSSDSLHFKEKPEDLLEFLPELEVYYETWRRLKGKA